MPILSDEERHPEEMGMNERIRHGAGIALAVTALWLNASLLPAERAAFSRTEAETEAAAGAVTEAAMEAGAGAQARVLIPGGQVVGVALHTQGVLVVAKAQREGVKSTLRVGDVILAVQGRAVDSVQALSDSINAAQMDTVELSVLRRGKAMTVQAAVPEDGADGRRRLGVWARDSTAGVGTLSYIDPVTQAYGALGHAIVDGDTGDVVSVRDGAIMRADVVGVTRGASGAAGELKGSFLKAGKQIGTLVQNSPSGIYGRMDVLPQNLLYPQGLPMGAASDVHEGPATIISTVDSEGPVEYTVEILSCEDAPTASRRDMTLQVTDARLLAKTGGIVQGMSGSPILQNGKLVGAVTHVLVNDPTRGYGIFIENMLEAGG